jgi:hypothetical protein
MVAAVIAGLPQAGAAGPKAATSGTTVSLEGEGWLLAPDPKDAGRAGGWWEAPRPEAKPIRVPSVIEDYLPGYHGLVWYWKEFTAPANPDPKGRYLIRICNADYKVDVWVNGKLIGSHEGADGIFELDATEAIRPDAVNRLAIRLLNPTDEPIDGITLRQTPHRNKTSAFTFGCDYNHGGLEDSVELVVCPAVRISDLHVRPNVETGIIRIEAKVSNALAGAAKGRVEISVAPAANGETLACETISRTLPSGESRFEAQIKVDHPRLWQLNDPRLYRVTLRLARAGSNVYDETSVRCGFRDFRIANGYFQLNGKRLFLRCSHTGNDTPVGLHVAYDREFLRRDLINVKTMGFNAIRFIAGLPTPYQLDLCDEIGLMVYDESYAAWLLEDSPKMAERFDRSVSEMILRDRNHPSVAIWGILNETDNGAVYRHAVTTLPLVRSLDQDRLTMLSSGRFDRDPGTGSVSNPGSAKWEFLLGAEHEGAGPAQGAWLPTAPGMGDFHIYPGVPHTADTIRTLRTLNAGMKPTFISEYGIATSVDLMRVARNFEQRGLEASGPAIFYRHALDLFMEDWRRWKMADLFGRPEEFFHASLARNAGQRLLGINAIRSNPNINGYSVTGTVDQGYSGEGLTTTFREMKPGTIDAIFDGFAPLRWCLFAEPAAAYRKEPVRLEAVLANEDVLKPGAYPARVEVFGPDSERVFAKSVTVNVPASVEGSPAPIAFPVFAESVPADWPSGKYRFVATMERGGAPAGAAAEFTVTDPAEMPKVEAEVVLWGEDPQLAAWLRDHAIRTRPFDAARAGREVILVGGAPASGGAQAFADLAAHAAAGSTVIFLSPSIFPVGEHGPLPAPIPNGARIWPLMSGIYHKEEWAKRHPIFDGLPAGLMDYAVYGGLISDKAWLGLDPSADAVAGAIHAAPGTGYQSGLLVSVFKSGRGRVIVNTLHIRDGLGKSPVAERLLRNMLNFAAE